MNFRAYRSTAKFRRANYFANAKVVIKCEILLREYFRKAWKYVFTLFGTEARRSLTALVAGITMIILSIVHGYI